jgi:hypothetical protein
MNCRLPNVLLIMADQWRADYIGALGNGKCATPHLDRIAQRGCLFTRAVTPNPVCQPARAALLTGRYPHQINLTAMNGDLRPDVATMPQAVQRAGYHTAIIGKLHFIHGTQPTKADYPRAREGQKRLGFDHIWEAAGKELVGHHYCDYAAALDHAGLYGTYLEHLRRAKTGGYLPDARLIADGPLCASGRGRPHGRRRQAARLSRSPERLLRHDCRSVARRRLLHDHDRQVARRPGARRHAVESRI